MTAADVVNKFVLLEAQIAQARGDFAFFALFMREEVPDRWDLMVSAPWMQDEAATVDYFVEQIKSSLGDEVLVKLSRIVVVECQNPAIQELNRTMPVEHGKVEMRDQDFFGQSVKLAYIIASRRAPVPVTT